MTTMNPGAGGVAATELRHGYTLADINKLTMIAVYRDHWHRGMELHERQELAWSAIVECLYSQDEPPSRHVLIQAAQVAIDLAVRTDRSTHGLSVQNSYAKSGNNAFAEMPNFWRYWWIQAGHSNGPEERVVDRLALWQIWTELAPRFQRVLLALATHDDHNLAAQSLGITRSAYQTMLCEARRAFYALWHEGEEPSRLWAHDFRGGRKTENRSVASSVIRRRAKRRQAAALAGAASAPASP
jgi:hypothetical protein